MGRASRFFLLAAEQARLLVLALAIFWLVPSVQALRPSVAVQPLTPSSEIQTSPTETHAGGCVVVLVGRHLLDGSWTIEIATGCEECAYKTASGLARWCDFYPNADGLMNESSDYAICYCTNCRTRYYDREFEFVSKISNEIWNVKPDTLIVVYPHYFAGRGVPGFEASGAKQKFDPRWTLFFTPHSAHLDPELLREAKTSILWNEGLSLGTPWKIRDGARTAKNHGMSGYIPSLEPMSCIDGPPGSGKSRQKPFHFDWLKDGEMPLNELLMKVNRIAYREFTRNPDLAEALFKRILGSELFGPEASDRAVEDLLFLQDCWVAGADWFSPTPLRDPARLSERAHREKWPADRTAAYEQRIVRLRTLAQRYQESAGATEREMHRIATMITKAEE